MLWGAYAKEKAALIDSSKHLILTTVHPSPRSAEYGFFVCRVAYLLGLTDTETFSLKNARNITEALAEVFPDDPCLGDFALFGSGVNGVL